MRLRGYPSNFVKLRRKNKKVKLQNVKFSLHFVHKSIQRDHTDRGIRFMKTYRSYSGIFALFCIVALIIGTASGATTTTSSSTSSSSSVSSSTTLSPEAALATVSVTGVVLDPPVFYPYEEGTIAVTLTNSGSQAVGFSQADLIDSHILLKNRETYNTMIYLGPGNSMTYTFLVVADPPDGTYFPMFTVASKEAGSLRYPIAVEVDSDDLRASITKMPDDFAASTKDTVELSIINPRNGAVKNIHVVPEGNDVIVSPKDSFTTSLAGGSTVTIPFEVTPLKNTNVTFHISFENGNNKHSSQVTVPITTGKDKTGAEIVVNNIQSSGAGGTMTLKGDVTNNGLTDAKSVLVTVGSPATPVNPNPVYAIGNLEPDDFSSFEVTYTSAGAGTIPLLVEYKDADGNLFKKSITITTNANMAFSGSGSGQNPASGAVPGSSTNRRGPFGSFGSGFGMIPVTEIVIILAALGVLIVAWKKGVLRRIADTIRHRKQ